MGHAVVSPFLSHRYGHHPRFYCRVLPGDLVRLVHLLLTFVLAFFRSIAVVLSGLVTAGIALKLLHLHAFHDGGVFAHCP